MASRDLLQAHQGDVVALEEAYQLIQVGHAAGEAIELIDDDGLHLARRHQGEERLEAGPFEVLGAIAFVANDVHERPILHQGIGFELRLLSTHGHAVPGLVLGTDTHIPDHLHSCLHHQRVDEVS